MPEVLTTHETEPSRVEQCRSSFSTQIKSLDERGKRRLDTANAFVRIFFKEGCTISPALWGYLEDELGSFSKIKGWLVVVSEFEPLDTWDEVINTSSPDGKPIVVNIKYTKEGNQIAGIGMKARD